MSGKRLLPLKIGKFFETGVIDEAVALGAAAVGWDYSGHTFADTERYMGLFHEVAPQEDALNCSSCHNGGTRLDFAALGYTPKETRNGKRLVCQLPRGRIRRMVPIRVLTRCMRSMWTTSDMIAVIVTPLQRRTRGSSKQVISEPRAGPLAVGGLRQLSSKLKGKKITAETAASGSWGTILRLGEKRPRLPARRAEPTARRVGDR